MARANRFSKIDELLPITTKGKGNEKSRKTATHRTVSDKIADEMAKCQHPSDLAMLASKFGFKDEDIIQWAKDAPNFGMFRMRIGNRLRGVMSRIAKAKKRGVELTVKEAAYAKRVKTQKAIAKKVVAKKVVAKKTATKKKVAKKKVKRAKKIA